MALFLSTYTNKVDRKGRVSLPAPFRAALSAPSVVLFRASAHPCIEGFGPDFMQDMAARLDHYDMFSAAQDDLATAIFGEAAPLAIDGDGRIVLPPDLLDYAGIGEQAAFVGMGRKFQLWEPDAFAARRAAARRNVVDQGLTLPRAKAEGGARE